MSVWQQKLIDHDLSDGCFQGDSGSPLLKVLDPPGVFVQIGVVSFGPEKGCGRAHPTGYSRISHYLDFIEEHTGVEMY